MSDKKLLKFPCTYPIKVMGEASLEFEALVIGIVRKHVPDLGEAAVKINHSKEQKYTALTVTVTATSQEQIDSIYRELTAEEKVLMAL